MDAILFLSQPSLIQFRIKENKNETKIILDLEFVFPKDYKIIGRFFRRSRYLKVLDLFKSECFMANVSVIQLAEFSLWIVYLLINIFYINSKFCIKTEYYFNFVSIK